MASIVDVRGIIIGSGKPKICAPIVGKTAEQIIRAAEDIKNSKADIAEFRADFFEYVDNMSILKEVLLKIRSILLDTPLLFTIRTEREGGEFFNDSSLYLEIIEQVVSYNIVDMIDIELKAMYSTQAVKAAKSHGVISVLSFHDFFATPSANSILSYLEEMECLGADIAKIAVMPVDMKDVFNVLSITEDAARQMKCPVCVLSMGKLGSITRVAGAYTGSALTFGHVGALSAPGQISVNSLYQTLEFFNDILK